MTFKSSLYKRRMLLMDEYPITAQTRRSLLQLWGCEVVWVSDLAQALSTYKEQEVDIVVIDPKAHAEQWIRVGQKIRRLRPQQDIVYLKGYGWPFPSEGVDGATTVDKEDGLDHFSEVLEAILDCKRSRESQEQEQGVKMAAASKAGAA